MNRSRVSQTIVLCEDETHERLIKAFMKICGLPTQPPQVKSLVASRMQFGGNVHWVLNEFPKQLHACRQRQKKAETLLIVMVDADHDTVDDRLYQLRERITSAGFEAFAPNDPAVFLIPKRHVETWMQALLGEAVAEDQDCKSWKKIRAEENRQAAQTLFDWSRANTKPGSSCVQSLERALPEWKRIG